MREIKFRAWDTCKKRMFEVKGLKQTPIGTWIVWDGETEVLPCNIELMQFTGLYDKNGKEVYEGDILQWCDITNVKDKWVVESVEGGWNPFIAHMTTDRPDRYEIVGNIYENPKLIPFKETI